MRALIACVIISCLAGGFTTGLALQREVDRRTMNRLTAVADDAVAVARQAVAVGNKAKAEVEACTADMRKGTDLMIQATEALRWTQAALQQARER